MSETQFPIESPLTPDQRAAFERDGVVRLEGFLPADLVERARAAVLRPLERVGFWRDGGWRLEALPRPKWPGHGPSAAKLIGNKHPEVAALFETAAVLALVDEQLEGRPFDARLYPRPQMLFTVPNIDAWVLPNGWHTDAPRIASGRSPGVQLFTLLEPVGARGGATAVVAGSHRLLGNGRSLTAKRMRHELGREPFFRQLWRKTPVAWPHDELPAGAVDNWPLRVVEMTGAPGDVWLMDLRLFHAASANAAATPRLMATRRFMRADVAREVAEAFGWAEAPRAE